MKQLNMFSIEDNSYFKVWVNEAVNEHSMIFATVPENIEALPGEEWRVVGESPNYLVSNKGRIYSTTNSIIRKLMHNTDGYPTIRIYIRGKLRTKTIHRLLAKAFIPNPENKKHVNHINGIKSDNRLENLEWLTQRENIQHAWDIGIHKKKIFDDEIMDMFIDGLTFKEIAERTDVSPHSIKEVVSRNHKNYPDQKYTIEEGWFPVKGFYGTYELSLRGQLRNVSISLRYGERNNKLITPLYDSKNKITYTLYYDNWKEKGRRFVHIKKGDLKNSIMSNVDERYFKTHVGGNVD
jgi:hypothetical protein